jgi:hypothetical protein
MGQDTGSEGVTLALRQKVKSMAIEPHGAYLAKLIYDNILVGGFNPSEKY